MSNQLKKNVLTAWGGCILTGISFSMVIPFLPILIQSVGVADAQLKMYSSMAISVTAISTILVASYWGKLADRVGKKKVMIIAASGTLFVMAGLAFTTSIVNLLFLRVISGSLQGYIPYATVLIASEATQKNKAKLLSFLATGLLIGNFFGPFIGGGIGDLYGVRVIFLVSSLVAGLCTLLTLIFISESNVEKKPKRPVKFKILIKEIKEPVYLLGLLGTSFIFRFCTMSINPLILLYMFQINPEISDNLKLSGGIIAMSSLASIMIFPVVGKMYNYISVAKVLTIGLLIEVSALICLANVNHLWQLSVAFFLIGIAQQMIVPSISSEITKISPVESRSRVFSLNVIAQNSGQVIGPLLGAFIVNSFSFKVLFYLLAGITTLVALSLNVVVKDKVIS